MKEIPSQVGCFTSVQGVSRRILNGGKKEIKMEGKVILGKTVQRSTSLLPLLTESWFFVRGPAPSNDWSLHTAVPPSSSLFSKQDWPAYPRNRQGLSGFSDGNTCPFGD